jgi:hypothetical protein
MGDEEGFSEGTCQELTDTSIYNIVERQLESTFVRLCVFFNCNVDKESRKLPSYRQHKTYAVGARGDGDQPREFMKRYYRLVSNLPVARIDPD